VVRGVYNSGDLAQEMELNGLNKADLSRKLRISRARVTQILNLLKLPENILQEVEEMGDHWERRRVTERMLRETTCSSKPK